MISRKEKLALVAVVNSPLERSWPKDRIREARKQLSEGPRVKGQAEAIKRLDADMRHAKSERRFGFFRW
jgi:hypothetical protein